MIVQRGGSLNRGKTLVLLAAVVLPVCVYGGYLLTHPATATRASPPRATPTPAARQGVPQLSVQRSLRLSDTQYAAVRAELFRLVDRKDSRAALDRLAALMNRDQAVLRSCHSLAHEIGHEAYRKYGDFAKALRYQDDTCGSGYMHGVVEIRLGGVQDITTEMAHICDMYAGTLLYGPCYHGVGHGVMVYTHNDLPRAIQLCDTLIPENARLRCGEGVYMENFNADRTVHPTNFVRESDFLYPCAIQPAFHKGTCYFYAPLYYLGIHIGDYLGALRGCDRAEPAFVLTCITGTGSRIEKQNIANPRFVERTCDAAGEPDKISACIDGMISYYLVNFDSLSKGRALCASLQPNHRDACYRGVSARQALFGP